MKNHRKFHCLSIFSVFFLWYHLDLQAQAVDPKLSFAEMSATIDSINNRLQKNYVFPEVADRMAQNLTSNFKKGKYNSVVSPSEFASQLTHDLRAVSNDKHLSVVYAPQLIAADRTAVTDEDRAKREEQQHKQRKRINFGFQEVKILDGNIGYLDLRGFLDPNDAGETAVAAMNFLSNADALIVDLRYNGGGSPAMIQLITSYFFSPEPVHLNNFYFRPTNENTQTWTLPYVPGFRRPDIDLYILTSSYTFSAAEEFSYNLKNLERATLVGETTGGGAHPTQSMNATDKFFVRVPVGRAINPISNTNWEGTGVTPHIEVNSAQALITAQIKALENLRNSASDSSEIKFYNWPLEGLKARNSPITIDPSMLKSYVGRFGPRNITYEGRGLYYQRDGGVKYPLIPMAGDRFMLDGLNSFRIEFLKEGNKVVALKGLYENGMTDRNLKDK
jgi:retinol-binding protein 3